MCSKDFFLKTVPLFDGGDDVGMVLSPQCFHNLNLHTDIFNHSNVHFWEYMQPGYDALGFISCTGTNFLVCAPLPLSLFKCAYQAALRLPHLVAVSLARYACHGLTTIAQVIYGCAVPGSQDHVQVSGKGTHFSSMLCRCAPTLSWRLADPLCGP